MPLPHTILTTVLLMLISVGASAQVPDQGYSAYRLVRTRNVFDPERRGSRSESSQSRSQQPRSSSSRSNFITLTGTMVTEGKNLAFFTGSRPEYSKVISVQEKVADFTVKNITAAEVELERGGKPIVVHVGGPVPLTGSVAETAEPISPAPDTTMGSTSPPSGESSSNATSTPTSASSAPSNDKSEVLRKMMERRQREMSK